MKNILLFAALSLLMLFSCSGNRGIENGAIKKSESKNPNVLFIIADDLALDRVGCYGDPVARTPAIDELASEGVLFDRAYAGGTVCTPSRKSFVTGLHVKTIGWGNNNYMRDNPEVMTMPRWFREHGYQTVKVGKIAHTDEFEGPHDWDINLNTTDTFDIGQRIRSYALGHSAIDGKQVMRGSVYPDDHNTLDEARTEVFERFITKKWDRSKPFFFALGFHTPHQGNDANERHFEQHPAERMPLTVRPEGATPMTKPFPENYRWWSVDFPEDDQRRSVQGYYAAVTMMDEMIGRVLSCLEEEGLTGNTIIVFTSDHGYCLGYRYNWAKHVLYPKVLRVPLIVKYPGMSKKGTRAQGLVELLDIYPTLAELSGLSVPEGLDGNSFVPLMEDPEREGKEAVYAQGILHRGNGMAVTTKDHTYMEWDEGSYREFYDLREDPDGWFNQVNSAEFSREVSYHEKLLHEHFNQHLK